MKGKALRKQSLHEKTAASVLLKLFISSNEWCVCLCVFPIYLVSRVLNHHKFINAHWFLLLRTCTRTFDSIPLVYSSHRKSTISRKEENTLPKSRVSELDCMASIDISQRVFQTALKAIVSLMAFRHPQKTITANSA